VPSAAPYRASDGGSYALAIALVPPMSLSRRRLCPFLLGWTILALSQEMVGAARQCALIGTTPPFTFAVGLLFFGKVLSLPVIIDVISVIAGVYLVPSD
jgi:drug/metabolite transporter (DMT)-like permease